MKGTHDLALKVRDNLHEFGVDIIKLHKKRGDEDEEDAEAE